MVSTFLITAFCSYALLVVLMYFFQRTLLYHPDQARPIPADYGLSQVEPVKIPSHDGLSVNGWWSPPRTENHPTVVYFHGNAGNLNDRQGKVQGFQQRGWGILLMSYRYNGGSGGAPSEDALIADGAKAIDWVEAKGIAPERIVLFGESLGTGIAVAQAARRPVAGVILEGAYDSILALGEDKYWFMPIRPLLKDSWKSINRIKEVHVPLLMVHGAHDNLIPPSHAERLFDAANMPKEFVLLENGNHVDLWQHGLWEAVDMFAEAFLPPQARN